MANKENENSVNIDIQQRLNETMAELHEIIVKIDQIECNNHRLRGQNLILIDMEKCLRQQLNENEKTIDESESYCSNVKRLVENVKKSLNGILPAMHGELNSTAEQTPQSPSPPQSPSTPLISRTTSTPNLATKRTAPIDVALTPFQMLLLKQLEEHGKFCIEYPSKKDFLFFSFENFIVYDFFLVRACKNSKR